MTKQGSIPVLIVNPQLIPRATQKWHAMGCACRGRVDEYHGAGTLESSLRGALASYRQHIVELRRDCDEDQWIRRTLGLLLSRHGTGDLDLAAVTGIDVTLMRDLFQGKAHWTDDLRRRTRRAILEHSQKIPRDWRPEGWRPSPRIRP